MKLDADAVIWSPGSPRAASELPFTVQTLAVSLRPGDYDGLLCSWQNTTGASPTRLEVLSADHGPELGFTLELSDKYLPIRLCAPLKVIGSHEPHEILLRHLGYRLEFFVDGVLVDEDWPAGFPLRLTGDICFHHPAVTRVTGWPRALDDATVRALCGSSLATEDKFFGPERPIAQGWRPRGFNVNVGDCMPYWHDGRFHLFYLRDRRFHRSMWGRGAHQWAHASTTDLRHWEQHPLAVTLRAPEAGSICTGSVIFHDGVHHAFYTVKRFDRTPAPLCVSTSRDGIAFTPHGPLCTLREPYHAPSGRDPFVFFREGQFHMLLTTSLVSASGMTGCLAHLVSDDLKNWEQRDPFFIPDADYQPHQPECSDYFEWNGWYYLIFGIEGVSHYRLARQPFGPWIRPDDDTFDDPRARVMKTAPFGSHRRLGVAFERDRGPWGGILRFRELVQRPDGTLTTRWPEELPPFAGQI